MLVYNYDPQTLEFIGAKEARESPKEQGVYLKPKYSTFTATTEADTGYARRYVSETGDWETVEDHRGDIVYKKSDATKVIVDWLGDVGGDYTYEAPSSPHDIWSGAEWTPPPATEEDIKVEAQRRIVAFCPEWKQRNMMMEKIDLLDKKRSSPLTFTQAEQDRLDLINDAIAHINAIRSASDTLEGTLPTDYTDDTHWPGPPGIDLDEKF